jgi:SAM-dependent methyltransferase
MAPDKAPTRHPDFGGALDHKPAMTRDELCSAYNEIHARGGMNAVSGYYDWLLSLLEPTGGRLLDVGCGTGAMLKAAAGRGFEVAGIDISDVAIGQARDRVAGAELHVGVAESLPFAGGSFDAVSCVGSLEHVADPAAAVREMVRVARPGAQLLVIVPNSRYLMMPVVRLRQWLFAGQSQPVERHATEQRWQQLLEASGIRVGAVYKDNHAYVPTRPLQALGRVAGALTPHGLSYQFVFVGRKPEGTGELTKAAGRARSAGWPRAEQAV